MKDNPLFSKIINNFNVDGDHKKKSHTVCGPNQTHARVHAADLIRQLFNAPRHVHHDAKKVLTDIAEGESWTITGQPHLTARPNRPDDALHIRIDHDKGDPHHLYLQRQDGGHYAVERITQKEKGARDVFVPSGPTHDAPHRKTGNSSTSTPRKR